MQFFAHKCNELMLNACVIGTKACMVSEQKMRLMMKAMMRYGDEG